MQLLSKAKNTFFLSFKSDICSSLIFFFWRKIDSYKLWKTKYIQRFILFEIKKSQNRIILYKNLCKMNFDSGIAVGVARSLNGRTSIQNIKLVFSVIISEGIM